MEDITTEEIVTQKKNLVSYYEIEGAPITLRRPRFGLGRVYDSQKKEKSKVQWELKSQHDYPLPFEGPLQLDVTFFMYIPNGLSKKIGGGEGGVPHYIRPDIDNLLKWILDCSNKILYNDDAQVTTVIARKIYSKLPRTEFSITRLEIL